MGTQWIHDFDWTSPRRSAHHGGMSEDAIQYLVLDRCDPTCNMARYYVLAIEPSLFGNPTLIREWGRIGLPGQEKG